MLLYIYKTTIKEYKRLKMYLQNFKHNNKLLYSILGKSGYSVFFFIEFCTNRNLLKELFLV